MQEFERIREIVQQPVETLDFKSSNNELEMLCGTLYEKYDDAFARLSDDTKCVSVEYFYGKLFTMKDAAQKYLKCRSNFGNDCERYYLTFDDFAYQSEGILRDCV
ncbi:hypothetical protein [Celeribacter neptunius]|uniref:Uncharacterized protein n=1 Tax=Celeribacter neptunius TaxID=588602 RepID=A0A1I3TVW1_9RHOB|nr:hypothetical protein [Celeribacter neptunius]SFJ73796.1 hypothetical protein SAMN04487991_2860 [Celeribacter neptunius]